MKPVSAMLRGLVRYYPMHPVSSALLSSGKPVCISQFIRYLEVADAQARSIPTHLFRLSVRYLQKKTMHLSPQFNQHNPHATIAQAQYDLPSPHSPLPASVSAPDPRLPDMR